MITHRHLVRSTVVAAALVIAGLAGVVAFHKPVSQWFRRIPSRQAVAQKREDPLAPAIRAYNNGDLRRAEQEAMRIIAAASSYPPAKRKDAARARYVLGFCAAGRKDFRTARDRFSLLRQEAALLPDKGKQQEVPGTSPMPTLEEQGAYQHAVCTAALGEKKAAQAEYMQFMKDFPESPLMNGVILRIRRLNNGHLPKEAEEAWMKSQTVARERDKARRTEAAMCGPECLAEILRRHGQKADVHALAIEMKTNEEGTDLRSLADAAKRRGFVTAGLSLTKKGLLQRRLPMIAYVQPGHYVIIDEASGRRVTVWDPDGGGQDKPSTRRYSWDEWQHIWTGIALMVQPG